MSGNPQETVGQLDPQDGMDAMTAQDGMDAMSAQEACRLGYHCYECPARAGSICIYCKGKMR